MSVPARQSTVPVPIRHTTVGAGQPVIVQSMTNTDTADAAATAAQVADLYNAGSELVRITVNNKAAAAAVPEIRKRLEDQCLDVPLIGDFHYNGHVLLAEFQRPHGLSTSTGSTPATSARAPTTTRTSRR